MIVLITVLACVSPGGPAADTVVVELLSYDGARMSSDEDTSPMFVFQARDQTGSQFPVFSSSGGIAEGDLLCVEGPRWASAWEAAQGRGTVDYGVWLEGVGAAPCQMGICWRSW